MKGGKGTRFGVTALGATREEGEHVPARKDVAARMLATRTAQPNAASKGKVAPKAAAAPTRREANAAPPAFREAPRPNPHRISVALDDLDYLWIRAEAQAHRVPGTTILRALVALARDRPRLAAEALRIAEAETEATVEARRTSLRK